MILRPAEAALRLFEVLGTIFAIHYLKDGAHLDQEFIVEVIIVPLLFIVFCELVHAKYIAPQETQEFFEGELNKLNEKLQKISECLASSELAPRLMIKVLGRASSEVAATELDQVWNQLTWALEREYFATNYVDYNHMFGNKRAQAIIATQRAKKLAGGVTIAKVFIVANAAEIASPAAKATLQLHRHEGITDLGYIAQNDIAKKLGDKFVVDPKKIDFAIFDGDVVLCWHYDDARKIKGGELLFGEEKVRPYREFADNLKSVAIPCPN